MFPGLSLVDVDGVRLVLVAGLVASCDGANPSPVLGDSLLNLFRGGDSVEE